VRLKRNKIKRKLVFYTAVAVAAALATGVLALRGAEGTFADGAKTFAKRLVAKITLPPLFNAKRGLDGITEEINFEDGAALYRTDTARRFVNYAEGYYLDLPADFEISREDVRVTAYGASRRAVITREWAQGGNADAYIARYLNRFILSPQYQQANRVTVTENAENGNIQKITAVIHDLDPSEYDTYTYVFFKTKSPVFYRVMFKYNAADTQFREEIEKTVNTFKYFSPKGKSGVAGEAYSPTIPDGWTDETKAVYSAIRGRTQPSWGVFSQDVYREGIEQTIPALERTLGYKFPVILSYLHFGGDFPTEFMQKNYNDGRLVELTYQTTQSNNETLFGYTPFLDIYRGKEDAEIRRFARDAADFGRPFLFRLNNEPNSDWTSYSGVVNMSDPEIFIDVWRRIYRIFQEEGVNNAIWIFNPNDRAYPPCGWNDFAAYYPGNGYVQIIGVTGYNNGTLRDGEKWREFHTIYDGIARDYLPAFGDFPWMITEFSSASAGGDKAAWIENMFGAIPRYPQIKIAVWFHYADYEVSPDGRETVSRAYWLDETPETLAAFRRGLETFDSEPLFERR
jgi:hypothetical protein